MDVVSPIIGPVVEALLVPIKKELGFLVSSRSYVRDMEVKMKQLNDAALDIEDRMVINNASDQVVPHHVKQWLDDIETINKDAEKILKGEIGCFNLKMRYKAGKQSCGILKDIDRLLKEKAEIEWTNQQVPLGMVGSASPSTNAVPDGAQNNFQSRDFIFKEALQSLEANNETKKIALCGMGGVGKTTMMKQLKEAVEHLKMFDWVLKVDVGQNSDPIALQQAIAEFMGQPLTETTKDARATRLRKRFARMSEDGQKKILVILDDLWNEVDLEDIGLMSPLSKGFKLILTTRSVSVCSQMKVETKSILKMGALNDAEAKSLFFGIVGHLDDDPELYEIGEEIIKRCGNLPIALKTIASSLKERTKEEWEEALSCLQRHDLQHLYDIAHKVFEISYCNLRRDDDKDIFLLSGLFPDDFDIPREELMRYGWGLKLFPKMHTIAEARRRVKTCINNLIGANLLIESDRLGCVKMHDLARSFALSNFTKVKQASIVNDDNMSERITEDANESYERILLKCPRMSVFPIDFNYPNLKLLKLMDAEELLKFPEDFYENMENLEVIAYEGMQYPLLPRSIQCSTNLRTLCLHGCELTFDFSSIGDLVNLEVLSFAECRIQKLPSVVGKLKKLRLLDLTGCFGLHIDDDVFKNLDSLEELYMRVYGSKAIRFTEVNGEEFTKLSKRLTALEVEFFKNMTLKIRVTFTKLERFKISMGCLLDENKDMHSFENTLKLVTNREKLMECKISELFKKTEKLHFQVMDVKTLEDVLMHPSEHSLCNLRVLHVSECADLRYLFTIPVACGLRKLEHLTVSSCHVLKSLVHGDSESGGSGVIVFQKLKFLHLKMLPMLGSLCDIEQVVELPQLEELILDELPEFTSIYADNNSSAMRPFTKGAALPELEILKIYSMEKLIEIWPSQVTTSTEAVVCNLREIEVQDCSRLVNIFPSNPMPLLHHLQELDVKGCGSVEELFNIDLECAGKMEEVQSSLRSIRVKGLKRLKVVWRIKGESNCSFHISAFQNVENIQIYGCNSFKDIFTPTTTNFTMKAVVDVKRESRDMMHKEALKSLEPNNRTQKIGICGMGGVGKTKMAEKLKKAAEDMKMFDWILEVDMGQKTEPFWHQQAMAQSMGETLNDLGQYARADRLYNKFKEMSQDGKNKILVILYDLWQPIHLSDIGLTSPLPYGFKLLLTSRDLTICNRMGVNSSSIFFVNCLEEQEAKVLFFETARLSDGDVADPELLKIGEEIVKRCFGHPVAIETMASCLRDNKIETWKDALSHLSNHVNDLDPLANIFRFSYNNLKNDDDRTIFVLSCLFSGNSHIPVENLVRYGWGLKLFNKVHTLAKARQHIKTCVNNLIRANFLTKSDRSGCVKPIDVLAYLIHDITECKQAVANKYMLTSEATDSCERLLLTCQGTFELPEISCYPNLKLLKLVDGEERLRYPENFYERMKTLEVLALESMHAPLLPRHSTELRTLCLDTCSWESLPWMYDISCLGNLVNLEILSFANCGIRELPSTIGKLKKLKLLDLTGCIDLCIDDGVFENLVHLEELYMRVSQQSPIRFTDANCHELEMLTRRLFAIEVEFCENKAQPKDMSFQRLERFKISIGSPLDEEKEEHNDTSSFNNTLKLVANREELLECRLSELFEKVEVLNLQVNDLNHLEEVTMNHSQQSFCNLRVLDVLKCPELRYLFSISVASGLTKLERLTVSSCGALESLIHCDNSVGGVIEFPELKFLSLQNLPQLVSFCDSDKVVELQELVELRLGGLPNFTSIYPDNNSAMQPFLNKEVKTCKLEKLKISYMEKLEQIWPSEEVNTSVLRAIEVKGCDSIVNLFPCNPLPLLSQLEELTVKKCDSIEVLFNIDLGCADKSQQLRSNLRRIRVEDSGKLREVWRIKGGRQFRAHIYGFEDVKSIHISNCKKFRNVFTPTITNFNMKALVDVTIDEDENSGGRDYSSDYSVNNGKEQEKLMKGIQDAAAETCPLKTDQEIPNEVLQSRNREHIGSSFSRSSQPSQGWCTQEQVAEMMRQHQEEQTRLRLEVEQLRQALASIQNAFNGFLTYFSQYTPPPIYCPPPPVYTPQVFPSGHCNYDTTFAPGTSHIVGNDEDGNGGGVGDYDYASDDEERLSV